MTTRTKTVRLAPGIKRVGSLSAKVAPTLVFDDGDQFMRIIDRLSAKSDARPRCRCGCWLDMCTGRRPGNSCGLRVPA